MSKKFDYDKLSFTIAGKHLEGKQVAQGIGLGLLITAIYGLRRFFKGGWCYLERDLTGTNVVITGGNNGIGRETAKRLVQLGARVIIGSRDQKRNREVVEEMSKINKGKIIAFRLDLADKKSIQQFAQSVRNELSEQPLHYLLNNAGIMALPQYKKTRQNLEMQIGVNHFGHFYLTCLLWRKLVESGNPRIVNVSSVVHMSPTKAYDIDFDNLHYQNGGYNSYAAYSRSKKANILFTKELQRRMQNKGINGTAVCLHPGAVRTDLANPFLSIWWKKALIGLLYPVILFTYKNVVQGAQTNIYCILEDDHKLTKGGYYADCKLTKTLASQVESREAATRLWEESEKVFGVKFL